MVAVRKVENSTSKTAAVGRVIMFISILSGLGTQSNYQRGGEVHRNTIQSFYDSVPTFVCLFGRDGGNRSRT